MHTTEEDMVIQKILPTSFIWNSKRINRIFGRKGKEDIQIPFLGGDI